MDKKLLREVTEELSGVQWLSRVGLPPSDVDTGFELEAEERRAIRMVKSREWEFATQEAQAWLTMLLSKEFRQHDREWDDVIAVGRKLFDKHVRPVAERFVKARAGTGKGLVDSIAWDVVHIVAERYYLRACPLQSPLFFSRVLAVYRAGRLACFFRCEGDAVLAMKQQAGAVVGF